MIYADNAATTPMSPAARETMVSLLDTCWGNASSLYLHGQRAREALEKVGLDLPPQLSCPPGLPAWSRDPASVQH